MKEEEKIRVICASCPLDASEAREFTERFKTNFSGKYLFSGQYYTNGRRQKEPLYYVVWVPPEDLPMIHGHEMLVERKKCLSQIEVTVSQRHLGRGRKASLEKHLKQ